MYSYRAARPLPAGAANRRDITGFFGRIGFDREGGATYHAPAMANPLLVSAAPENLARRKQVIESVEKLSTFKRLEAIVAQDLAALASGDAPANWGKSPITVCIEFGWADAREHWPRVTGRAAAAVPAVCQRCLEVCTVELDVDIDLLLLKSSDTRSADEALEVWEMEQDQLRPIDVVEELLIMAMPLAAMHAQASECGVLLGDAASGKGSEAGGDTNRPFAELKDIFKQSH